MNVRIPASSNPRSPGRYLPVRFPADALAGAQSIAKGVQNIGAAAVDASEAANRMRLETERRQEQADKLGGINALGEWHATFGASLLTDQNPLGYEKRFNEESETQIQKILSGIPPERRGNLEESLRDRQSNYRVNAIAQAGVISNRLATRNFESNYKRFTALGDEQGVNNLIDSVTGTLITGAEGENMKLFGANECNKFKIKKQEDELEGLSVSNPEVARDAIESRKFNLVSPQALEKAKENVRRYMASISPREAVTEESREKIARGESVSERSSLRYGATEKEWRWNKNFTTTGTYNKDVKEITTEFSKALDSVEFPDTDAKAKQIGDDIVKRWGRYSSSLMVTEDQMRLLVDDKLNSIRGKIQLGNRNDIDLIAQSLPDGVWFPEQVKRIEGEDKDDPDRQKLQQELQGSKEFITAKVKTAMTEYRITNPKASLSDDKSHMLYLFAKYTQESFNQYGGSNGDVMVHSLKPNVKESEKATYYKNKGEEFNQGMIDKEITDTVEKGLIPEKQNEKNANYIKGQKLVPVEKMETAPQICPISYSSGTGGKEGVYVSKQAWETLHKRFSGNPWVKVELESGQPGFAKGAYSYAPVLGFYEGNDRGIEIRGEETSKRLIMFDGDKGRANIRFLQGEDGGSREASTFENKASARIINNEARFDKRGNLTIYKLPEGDGGGEYEIAGINQKNHSQEFNKLAGMLQEGRHQEAKEEAANYIDRKTSRVGELLQNSGVQNDGIDYLLRDMCFNGGESFPARVIHRSLGIPDSKSFNGNTGEAISAYLQDHSEEELLAALKQGRDNLYRSIAANNPEKKKFLRGWLNRSASSYKEAMQMA